VALQRRPHLNLDSSEHNRQVGWSREQSTADLRAARYDSILAGENWARLEQAGLPQLAGSRKSARSRPYLWDSAVMVISAISDGALDPTPVDTHIPQQPVIKLCQLDSGLSDAPFAAQMDPESADVLPTFLDEIGPDRRGDMSTAAIPRVAKFDGTGDRSG
jgi:hypothetical protein